MATAAEKKAAKEAAAEQEAAAKAAQDQAAADAKAAAEGIAEGAEAAAVEQNVGDAEPGPQPGADEDGFGGDAPDRADEDGSDEDGGDFVPAAQEGPVVTDDERALAKQGAVRGVAVSPLELPEPSNPIEAVSDPNIPEGLNAVVEAYADRGSHLAAEDGQPIDPDTLWLGPDTLGQYTSTVRIVEHSTVEPYGHSVTTLVVGAGVSVPAVIARKISAQLAAQADDAAEADTPLEGVDA